MMHLCLACYRGRVEGVEMAGAKHERSRSDEWTALVTTATLSPCELTRTKAGSSSDGRQKRSPLCPGTNWTPTESRPITRRHHQGRGCGSLRTSTGTWRSGRPGSRSTSRHTRLVGGDGSGRTRRTQSGAAQTISSRPGRTNDQTRSCIDRRSPLRPIISPLGRPTTG